MSFMQFLNKLFKIQIAAGDILKFESDSHNKFFNFSLAESWDEIIRLPQNITTICPRLLQASLSNNNYSTWGISYDPRANTPN